MSDIKKKEFSKPRSPKDQHSSSSREPRPKPRVPRQDAQGAAGALIELDKELMKLLVRRATLVSRIREGKEHAASPAAIQAEKSVRIAWETNALSFSKDPRFSRQLFTLLQDLKVLSKEQAENTGSFNLSPSVKPVSGEISGPTSVRAAQMRMALAACLGKKTHLSSVMMSNALHDCFKTWSQAGATLKSHDITHGHGEITVESGPVLSFAGKTVFIGEDPFTLYLLVFMALGQPGVMRLNGGSGLKSADLSALRNMLPLFGARLAHVVPRSQGLPANLECSGEIPPHILVPSDLPQEALGALLLAPLAWSVPVTLDLSALPASTATAALAEVRPMHRDCEAEIETLGPRIVYTPVKLRLPEKPILPLDPVLSSYLLALPAFTGGSLFLKGTWPSRMPEAAEAEQLFAWAGLEFCNEEGRVGTRLAEPGENTGGPHLPRFSLPMQNSDISPELGPLFLSLSGLCRKLTGAMSPLHTVLPFPAEDTEIALAQDFFSRLGLSYENDRLESLDEADNASAGPPSWTSPSAYWSMAYALASFLRPGLQLANPGNISESMPSFWTIYNSLPSPVDPGEPVAKAKEAENDGKPVRRRIIAD